MEMQFDRIPINYLEKLTGQLRSQEQTLEVRLPDGMPDIGRVLGAWGQVIVRGKEWNSDSMAVSCGVMAWVLYTPEDGEDVRGVEVWLPFSMKWELPETRHDGTILVSCLLRGVDARSISARKLMVRANLEAIGEAWLPGEAQIAVPGELPEDVRLLTATYPVMLPREAGEKAFFMEEQLNLPATGPKPEKLLYYSLEPEILDKKVMAGKVVFRGIGVLHALYRGEDGKLYTWDYELPFSQYADLDGEYDQDPTVTVYPCVTSLDLSLDENGILQLKAGVLGQYLLCERSMITVAEDAYSPHRAISLVQEQLQLPAILDQTTQTIHAEQMAQVDAQQILDLTFYPEYSQVEQTESGVRIPMQGQFQLLYHDEEGEQRCILTSWEDAWSMDAAQDSMVDFRMNPVGKPQGVPGAGTVSLRADMNVDIVTSSGRGISMITGMEMGELEKPNPNRPSLILCKKDNRRLWDMAKNAGSTVEAIMEANHLETEPEDGRVLLIPVL